MRKLVLALGFMSFATFGSPCEQVFSESVLMTSGVLERADPTIVKAFKDSTVRECEAAVEVGKSGLPPQAVTYTVIRSVEKNGDAFYSLLTATRLQMVMTGWAIGAESK